MKESRDRDTAKEEEEKEKITLYSERERASSAMWTAIDAYKSAIGNAFRGYS